MCLSVSLASKWVLTISQLIKVNFPMLSIHVAIIVLKLGPLRGPSLHKFAWCLVSYRMGNSTWWSSWAYNSCTFSCSILRIPEMIVQIPSFDDFSKWSLICCFFFNEAWAPFVNHKTWTTKDLENKINLLLWSTTKFSMKEAGGEWWAKETYMKIKVTPQVSRGHKRAFLECWRMEHEISKQHDGLV